MKRSESTTASNPGPWLMFGTPALGVVIMFIAEPTWFFYALGVGVFIAFLCVLGAIMSAISG